MRFTLDSRLTVEQNAAIYFERAKKARKKAEGARRAMERAVRKHRTKRAKPSKRKPAWYERFRWFVSSDGVLCVGARDAAGNEEIVKKHVDKDDVVFHTDIPGSPFVVVKSGGEPVPETTLEEAAIFTASYSRGWRQGLASVDVFHVLPEQLSKTPESGEYLGRGAFIVRGERTYMTARLGISVGVDGDGRLVAGPASAIAKRCEKHVTIVQGAEKTSDVARAIASRLSVRADDVVPLLPAGGVAIR